MEKKYNIFGINLVFHNEHGYEDNRHTTGDEYNDIKKGILISEKICYDEDDEDESLGFKFFIIDNIYQVGDCIYMEKDNRVLLKIYNIPKNFHIILEFNPREVNEDCLNRIYSYNTTYTVKYMENENQDINKYLETLDDENISIDVLSDLIEYLHIRDGSFLDKFKSNTYRENIIYMFRKIDEEKLIIFKNRKDTKSHNNEDNNIKQKSSTNIWI